MQAYRNHNGRRSSAWLKVVPVVLFVLASCTGGDSITQPSNNVATMPWKVTLNLRAINLAVGQSVHLEAAATTVDGTPVGGANEITWEVPDTTIISVDADGNLLAKAETYRALVIAKIHNAEQNWTIADSARVTVYPTVLDVASYKMLLDGPTLIPANVWRNYDAVLVDAAGNVLLDAAGDTIYPVTDYVPSRPRSVWNQGGWNGGGSPNNVGEVSIRADSYIFGTQYHDSVTFMLTYPDTAPVLIYRKDYNMDPSPSIPGQTDITILKGGVIQFSNVNPTQKADILFDDTTAVIGGNIPEVPVGYAWQTPPAEVVFPNTGVFTYSSPTLGFTGTITVVDWPEWP